MTLGVSNGHMTSDVMQPWKVRVIDLDADSVCSLNIISLLVKSSVN